MEPLEIKGTSIGEGVPKTIVSLMDPEVADLLATIEECKTAGVDCLEWRADFSVNVRDSFAMVQDGRKIAAACPDNPLLFTFRSASQGGRLSLPVDEYLALNRALIEDGQMDLVDIETWIGDAAALELIACAKAHGVKTILSYHDFKGTPSVEWMVSLLTHMIDLGADIPKLATMAHTPADALHVMEATEQVARLHFDGPLLTMAMGRDGSITRLTGESFGSALSFCALHDSSAPGQVGIAQAQRIMKDLHAAIA